MLSLDTPRSGKRVTPSADRWRACAARIYIRILYIVIVSDGTDEISIGGGRTRVRDGRTLLRRGPFRAPVRVETRRVHGRQQVSRVVVRPG